MNVFEAVKQSVTTRQAAEHYGIHVGRNGMACCPFHNDKTPSMKLDRRYHCFGCGADGDVIDFAAALYGLRKKEAAARKSGNRKAAHEYKGGKQSGNAAEQFFMLHLRFPPAYSLIVYKTFFRIHIYIIV